MGAHRQGRRASGGRQVRSLPIRRIVRTLAVLVTAGVFLFLLTPPASRRLDPRGWDDLAGRTIPGAYHVHSTRSDGHGDRAAIAGAAARAGLKFVIVTDHGDGTRPPDAPAYIDGVLVLDGVEISTDDGHYVAIDMPRAPYPLGGTGESVIEDVRRLGGFGFAAHPDSPKPALRWTSTAIPDGLEWLNLDSEWRDEGRLRLLRTGAAYFIRPAPALTMILSRPATLDARWPALLASRPTIALAAADAHGGVGRRNEDVSRSLAGSIGIPSYEASFRAFSNRVILPGPLSGDAAADAKAIYRAIRGGSVFSSIDAQAAPALIDFAIEAGYFRGGMGTVIGEDADATLTARALVPDGSEISIVRNGRTMTSSRSGEVRHVVTGGKGAYRVEIVAPGAHGTPPVPWLISNAIYFGEAPPPHVGAPLIPPSTSIAPFPWRIEKDAASSATLRTGDVDATLEFKLAEGERHGQFVAMATDLSRQPFQSIDLGVAGDRPMRVSVQLRTADGRRWGKSYYVDPAGSTLHVAVNSLRPIGGVDLGSFTATDATSLLLVIDLTNAVPGRSGSLKVVSSAFAR